jgi:hypothetical protein
MSGTPGEDDCILTWMHKTPWAAYLSYRRIRRCIAAGSDPAGRYLLKPVTM